MREPSEWWDTALIGAVVLAVCFAWAMIVNLISASR